MQRAQAAMVATGRRVTHYGLAALVVALLAALAFAPSATSVRAATDTVMNCSGNPTTVGSLPNVLAGAATNDTIVFAQDCTGANAIMLTATLTPAVNVTIDATTPLHTVTVTTAATSGVGLFTVNNGITLGLRGLTLSGGNTTGTGGAISNSGGTVTITGCTLYGNSANDGGAIYNGGTATIMSSTLSGNTASDGGGAINNRGTLSVTGSTFTGNTANTSGGGAIINGMGTVTITNSTISGNNGGNIGGALSVMAGTVTTITASTISGNTAGAGGGIGGGGTLKFALSIVAGNTATGGSGPDIQGILSNGDDGGGNVIGNTDAIPGFNAASDKLNVSPLLAPLAVYAPGTVATFALLPGSPAIDIAPCPTDPITGTILATDARGVGRPQGANCDSGAFESRGFTVGALTGNNGSARPNTAFASPLGLTVTSANGEPVAGGQVTFTIIPGAGGASAIFGAGTGCTVTGGTLAVCTVGMNGVVVTPSLTANGTLGTFTVTATAAGAANVTYTETITNSVNPPLVLPAGPLPNATTGAPYSQTLTATGGTGTGYTYTLTPGSTLPTGLTLNPATGTISGAAPTVPGVYSFSITVTDSGGASTSRGYTLTVVAPNVTPAPHPVSAPMGMPAVAPLLHAPGMGSGAGTPTPLPQPVRH